MREHHVSRDPHLCRRDGRCWVTDRTQEDSHACGLALTTVTPWLEWGGMDRMGRKSLPASPWHNAQMPVPSGLTSKCRR